MGIPNREKGDVPLVVGDVTYILRGGTEAMVALEDLFSTPQHEVTFFDVVERVKRGSVRYIRATVWAMLQHHHPSLTLADVGRLIDAVGLESVNAQLSAVTASATPDPRDMEAAGVPAEGKGKPGRVNHRRRGGTGEVSTSTPAASA